MGSSNRAADGQRSSLIGRVCMVTGANGGLGEVVAMELARRGATVVLDASQQDEPSSSASRPPPGTRQSTYSWPTFRSVGRAPPG
jgi:hypothetical protein